VGRATCLCVIQVVLLISNQENMKVVSKKKYEGDHVNKTLSKPDY